ncbi:DUF5947 family protein [Phytohabitans flavus]|uniref:DUF5947 family protein n=1 Tax=Phytohabitans flavus TaxID=1076124 RepID=UPI00362EEAC7
MRALRRPVGDGHRHVLDERDRSAMCACQACTLLFDRDGAGGGHFRLIPTGRSRLTGIAAGGLDVPVGLAFFVRDDGGAVTAHYPSPLGITESTVDAEDWASMEGKAPQLAAMAPLVEAFLVRANARADREEAWLLPIDDCYRLVAVIRRHWAGMSGGAAVWREVATFFAGLDGDPARHPTKKAASEGSDGNTGR